MAKLEANVTVNLDVDPSERLRALIQQLVRKELLAVFEGLTKQEEMALINSEFAQDIVVEV